MAAYGGQGQTGLLAVFEKKKTKYLRLKCFYFLIEDLPKFDFALSFTF